MPDLLQAREIKYWWVNQNQTFKQEFEGGYLWSPRLNSAGKFNPFYENMREVAPGDIIFSFVGQHIKAISVAIACAGPSPKPEAFGDIGSYWHPKLGWMVPVKYKTLKKSVSPSQHIGVIRPFLPTHRSPLQSNGRGNQAYLFSIGKELAEILIGLIGEEAKEFASRQSYSFQQADILAADKNRINDWENAEEKAIDLNPEIPTTEKEYLRKSRLGQGIFRQRLMDVEKACRITKVENPEHLIGSHIRPWRESDNKQRLDGENGFLLTPTVDHLFDRGFISFENTGKLLIAPVADMLSLPKMGIPEAGYSVGAFTSKQKEYLDFHRDMIFLRRSR